MKALTSMMVFGFYWCIVCVLIVSQPVLAQTPVKIAQIDGGSISSLCSNKFGDLYCSALNQVYRSIDQGQSWQKQMSPIDTLVDVQLVAPNDENSLTALFAIARGKVWKSTDDGQRWSTTTGLLPYVETESLRNIFSPRDGALLASVRSGSSAILLRSRDNGVSFDTLCSLPADVTSVIQSPDSSYYVFADRAYRIETSGTVSPLGAMRVVNSYREFFNAPVAVWAIENNLPVRSTNKGADWKSMKYNWNDVGGSLFHIIIDRESNAFAFVRLTDSTRVYRLNNGATSWTLVKTFAQVFQDVIININGSFVASTEDGMYSSEDNGSSWTRTSRGISTYPISCAVTMENVVGVAGFDGVIWQTNTGGLSWSTSNIPPNSHPLVVSEIIGTKKGKLIAATSSGIWVSSDLGLNYIVALSSKGSMGAVSSVSEIVPGVLYATGYDGLMRSTDEGLNWSILDTTSYENASIARAGAGRFVLSTSQGLLTGDTSSSTLSTVTTSVSAGRCTVSPNGTVYTAAYGVGIPGTYPVLVQRTKSTGATEDITIPSSRTGNRIPIWVATGSANEAYVNTDIGLFRIAENSRTPERIDVPNEVCTYVHARDNGSIVFATAYGGVYTLDVSSSVDEPSSDIARVSPQPALNSVTIECTESVDVWSVQDIHGKNCMQGVSDAGEHIIVVPTYDLPNGVYVFVGGNSAKKLRVPFVVAR